MDCHRLTNTVECSLTTEYNNQIRLIYSEPTDWNAMTHERRDIKASDHASDP
ncbi:hypothetical protein LI200_10755 [Dorea formicigenerans]|nr:hypothetical protein [Dorea formicigenerans]